MHFVHLQDMSSARRGVWGIGGGRDKTLLARSEGSAEMVGGVFFMRCVHNMAHCCLLKKNTKPTALQILL